MTGSSSNPTETSPLLANPVSTAFEPGDAPVGVRPIGPTSNGDIDSPIKPGDDEERRGEDDEGGQRYEGMPEVKKKLKYIVPAIAIGVGCFLTVLPANRNGLLSLA